ncbi:DUF2911 domain-containing protein [Marinoscillum sp. MHG1-6]|uniref:DUF2911 domain-containing protein n=1 Tax=Marinoscillum sp. MHG1-6 TaxID=2959627 RepID=UPI0021570582|nr:DUF2911 domain-containing protein [Marinoscillum sp. MHG1-6]
MILGAGSMYLNHRNRTLSPPGSDKIKSGDLTVSVSYSRPSVKGRLIFGSESEGALQPWGKYWRLGANESTEITFSGDVMFNGQAVEAGTYKMYAIPGEDEFEILLNTSLGDWGYEEADHDLDILSTSIPVINGKNTEQHTISLQSPQDGSITIIVAFSDVRLEIYVKAQS